MKRCAGSLSAGGHARGVDYGGGRRAHMWAKEAGFELVHVDAYHPHYLAGEHKGFWNWTMRNAGLGLVTEGSLSMTKLEELVAGMNKADESPDTVVAHCRMHQVIARRSLTAAFKEGGGGVEMVERVGGAGGESRSRGPEAEAGSRNSWESSRRSNVIGRGGTAVSQRRERRRGGVATTGGGGARGGGGAKAWGTKQRSDETAGEEKRREWGDGKGGEEAPGRNRGRRTL